MNRVIFIINWIWTVLFLLFAGVQINDSDSWIWISVYVFFALLALSANYFQLHRYLYLICGAFALVWAWYQWPERWEGIGESMLTENMERGRESLGLIICAVSTLFFAATVAFKNVKQKRS